MHARVFLCFIWIVIIFSPGIAQAQTRDSKFLTFDQFFQNYPLFNPASSDSTGKVVIRLANSSLYGLFEGVNRQYFDADIRPGKMGDQSYSRVGALVHRSNDGPFINRTRYYGRYSRTVRLKNDQYLSLGMALGAASISLKGSQAIGGGTSTAFDGYTGAWYYRKKLKIGVSLEHFTQSVLKPIRQSFKLGSVLNLNAVYSSYISSQCLFFNHFYFRNEVNGTWSFEYAPVLLLSEIVEVGTNFKFKQGIAILLGVKTHTLGLGKISFMGSFLLSTRKLSTSADNKFEISARYSI